MNHGQIGDNDLDRARLIRAADHVENARGSLPLTASRWSIQPAARRGWEAVETARRALSLADGSGRNVAPRDRPL